MREAARLLPGAAVVVLAACGSPGQASGELADALVVELPGYVPAAARPMPETLCDPLPSGTGPTPPALSAVHRRGYERGPVGRAVVRIRLGGRAHPPGGLRAGAGRPPARPRGRTSSCWS